MAEGRTPFQPAMTNSLPFGLTQHFDFSSRGMPIVSQGRLMPTGPWRREIPMVPLAPMEIITQKAAPVRKNLIHHDWPYSPMLDPQNPPGAETAADLSREPAQKVQSAAYIWQHNASLLLVLLRRRKPETICALDPRPAAAAAAAGWRSRISYKAAQLVHSSCCDSSSVCCLWWELSS